MSTYASILTGSPAGHLYLLKQLNCPSKENLGMTDSGVQRGWPGATSHHLVGSASCSLPVPFHNPSPRWVCQPLHCRKSLPPGWVLQLPPCRESCLPGFWSPPLLPVWMNVSSLSPWLSDFHTVRFSFNSGCFFVFKVLLPLFWLWEEAQCVYLCLHLVFLHILDF